VEVLARHAAVLFIHLMTVEARAMNGTQTFQCVRPAEFYSADTGRRSSGKNSCWAQGALGLCSSTKAL
jgi:hypothetical protein